MFKGTCKISRTDNLPEMEKALRQLTSVDVLVGISEEDADRPEEDGINNAELAYIHTHGVRHESMRQEMDKAMEKGVAYGRAYKMYVRSHGSPLWHIPPRPIIEPAIEDPENQKTIADDLQAAAEAALDGDEKQAIRELHRAGMDAQNAVRGWFNNPKNNWPPNAESTIRKKGSDEPLVNTAEMQKAISYVIAGKDGQKYD